MPTYHIIVICAIVAFVIFGGLIATIVSMDRANRTREQELERMLFECEENRDARESKTSYNE